MLPDRAVVGDDFRLGALNERANMFGPSLKRLPLLGCVQSAVVDAGHPGLVPRDVVENGLHDMWQNPKFGHAGRDGSADVMQAPRAAKVQYSGRCAVQPRLTAGLLSP